MGHYSDRVLTVKLNATQQFWASTAILIPSMAASVSRHQRFFFFFSFFVLGGDLV
ncbi:MAG: hypothetical protein VKJ64_08305 [Leptolyngbyaceae bacterium]|nr:hypothetical protein [Leptolyngbyaceae bacterium]